MYISYEAIINFLCPNRIYLLSETNFAQNYPEMAQQVPYQVEGKALGQHNLSLADDFTFYLSGEISNKTAFKY